MSAAPSNPHTGHVFLAHGRIESVVHDAAVVPTDRDFSVRPYWDPVIGVPSERAKPSQWPAEFARSSARAPVWFIDVGDVATGGADMLANRAARVIEAISASGLKEGNGRTKLRIAMPIVGIAGGGLERRQGDVLERLNRALIEAARRHRVDVVLVTPVPSVFSAAQYVRRALSPWPLSKRLLHRARHIGGLARQGHLALFLGAGVSVPAGLPQWGGLLAELAAGVGLTRTDLEELSALDQAQLLSIRIPDLGSKVARIASRAKRPALAHALLAGLACGEVVTTNYDRLYEKAVQATGGELTTILPWQDSAPARPWILKMHGDVTRPNDIVLTRRHFVRYDADARPAGSMLQALLLTRHLLFVGASLNDDNVSRLVHEVDAFRSAHGRTGKFGTFLDVDAIRARKQLWSEHLNWITLPGLTVERRARTMEVFLDAVAAYATTNASWLLDERFSGLLSSDERMLADEIRAIHSRAKKLPGAFDPLVNALSQLGADADEDGHAGP